MSKFKKHKPKRDENPNRLDMGVLEEKARSDMAQENFRRAKESLKELCKRDKEKFLPLLIECYNGLARQMIEKGQTSEAKTVLDQIRQLTGGEGGIDPRADVFMALASGDYRRAAEALIGLYGDGNNPLSPEDSDTFADTLVIAFEDFPRLKEMNPRLHEELTVIRKGLELASSGSFAEALDEVKPIRIQSPFAGWRLFIKGMCAFYRGEDSKAREAFQRLESRALLSRAARPFLFVVDGAVTRLSKEEPKELLLSQAVSVLNRPDMETVLPRAEYLWYLGRHADSYEHTARTLAGFPTEGRGLAGTMTRFYLNAPFHMEYARAERYVMAVYPMKRGKKASPRHTLLFSRQRNLFIDHDQGIVDEEFITYWEEFLTNYSQVHEENPKLRALVYAHLGELFSREERDVRDYSFSRFGRRRKKKVEVRNHELAEEAYEKSLALVATDREVHMGLLNLYEKTGAESKRNKKLDQMSRLFPDDRDVLAKNGNFCVERKAFIKGIDYLKRALALDPLDRVLREDLCGAHISASYHFAVKGSVGRYREFVKEAVALTQADASDMHLGRPYIRMRHALLEWIAGFDEEGDRIFVEVIKESGNPEQMTYFAYFMGRIYEVPNRHVLALRKRVDALLQEPLPAVAAAFADVAVYCGTLKKAEQQIYGHFRLLNDFALKAARKAFTPLEAERIVRYALDQRSRGLTLARTYIRKILKADPRNPLFLYFEYSCDYMIEDPYRPSTREKIHKLEEILALAVERGDRVLVDTLNGLIHDLEMYLPEGGYEEEDDEDDYEDDYDISGSWQYEEDDEEPLLDPAQVMEVVKQIKNAGKKGAPRRKRDPRQPSLFDDDE